MFFFQGLTLMCCVCIQYSDNVEFLWRLARAYNDMCEHAEDEEERRSFAEQGKHTHTLPKY